MNSENPTTSVQERMADLKETLKKEKVKLTPEVEQYIQEHVRAVQDKLQAGEPVYEEDLAFIDEVKLWVGMPEEWRKKYVSIGDMQRSEEQAEAAHRHISLKQWLDVLHVAKAKGENKEWIDETFTFPGGGKIEVEWDLDLEGCTELTTLPEGLEVGGFLRLSNCMGLTSLPEGLKVGRFLYLVSCTRLTTLPEGLKVGQSLYLSGCTGLTILPEGFKARNEVLLSGCTGLTCLPEGMEVGGGLKLAGCTGLTALPEGLKVGKDLVLSEDLHEQVKKDAERLKAEGRIGGEIRYM